MLQINYKLSNKVYLAICASLIFNQTRLINQLEQYLM